MKADDVQKAYDEAREALLQQGQDAEAALTLLPSPPPSCPFNGHEEGESVVDFVRSQREKQKAVLRKALPSATPEQVEAIYNVFCLRCNVPVADEWIADVEAYVSSCETK